MFSLVILSIIDQNVKSVKETWAISEKDKVTFNICTFLRYPTVELIYSMKYASGIIQVSVTVSFCYYMLSSSLYFF